MEVLETVKDTVRVAANIGHFVTERLVGGAWAKLAETVYSEQDYQLTLDHIKSVAGSE